LKPARCTLAGAGDWRLHGFWLEKTWILVPTVAAPPSRMRNR
jgi:hypothetical protein